MLYREFGKTGEKLSILGFGAMRLPLIDGDDSRINEEEAVKMVRHCIDEGVNYLDTAWPYHGGTSEAFCGKVMKNGYRDKVKIATKFPSWEDGEMMPILDEQLKRLDVDCIDFYLMHALCQNFWAKVKKNDYAKFLREAKAQGKIKHIGFSYHDDIDLFKEIIDDFEWDFVQIQLNYLDDGYQAGLEGMKYAHDRDLGVIVMEPLRGGMLARTELPETIANIWAKADKKRTPAEWALRYVWDLPEVGVVLSGMSTMDQVKENIKIASEAYPLTLTPKENQMISDVKDYFIESTKVNCTNCRYCMPCPHGVNIPECFWAYNHDSQFDDFGKGDFWINGWLTEDQRPDKCTQCGECEEHCPQHIEIRKHLGDILKRYMVKE